QQRRGAANGLAMTAMSLFKAVGPASAGALFSWIFIMDFCVQVVFFILNVVEAIAVLMTFKPFCKWKFLPSPAREILCKYPILYLN
ncbi:unnamed protein product, partial [Prunus brigantina]